MRSLAGATYRALRRVLDLFPLTFLGLIVGAGAGAALYWIAYQELDLIWLVIGYLVLGLLAASLLAVTFTAIGLAIATRRRPHASADRLTVETSYPMPSGFSLPTLDWMPLIQIRWTWERPASVDVDHDKVRQGTFWLRRREKITARVRGKHASVRRRIVIEDAFGLARLAIRQTDALEVTALPHTGKLDETPMLVSLAGGDERPHPMGIEDGDRVELRRYAPGDPARFIHWKVFSRTRRLMVRMPERALSPARRTVSYLVAGPGDEASAAAARVALEGGAFGSEWTFSADGATADTSRVDEGIAMIVGSQGQRGAAGLRTFLERAERTGPASAVLFVPPRPGPWLDLVVTAARARAARTRIVVATDGVDPKKPPSIVRRLLLRAGGASDATPSRDLERVLTTLAQSRAEVIVLDRVTGRRLGQAHRRAMAKREKVEDAA
ncbi:MAG: DUF58 domain-containing protein [Sandaracinaceae bacterium]